MIARATISALLVDDEQLAREELSYLLKEFPDIEVLASARNGLEALKIIQQLQPRLRFLGVHKPGLDGLGDIAKLRRENIQRPHFSLANTHNQEPMEAFHCDALQYP